MLCPGLKNEADVKVALTGIPSNGQQGEASLFAQRLLVAQKSLNHAQLLFDLSKCFSNDK